MKSMKFGLHGVNLNTCGYPDAAARLGRAAGFDLLWVADHVVLAKQLASLDVLSSGRPQGLNPRAEERTPR